MSKYKFVLIGVIIILLPFMFYSYSQLPLSSSSYPSGPHLTQKDRVLVVAPHPDDETIAAGGVINYCTNLHIPLKVVVLTDGDGYHGGSAAVRYNETLNATHILGLNPDDVIFLGYPDGGLYYLFNQNWDPDKPYSNHQGGLKVNYTYSFRKNQTICGANLEKDLEDVINEFQPTVIIYPDGDDQQEDHKAAQAFLEYTTSHMNYTGSKYNYLVHFAFSWPYPRTYNPEYNLLPPKEFKDAQWKVFPINITTQRIKEKALTSYHSQVGLSSYLLSFVRRNELFSTYNTLNLVENNVSFTDPSGPENDHQPPPELDLEQVGIQLDKDKMWLYLTSKAPLSATGYYNFKIVSMGDQVHRFDIQYHQGQVQSSIINSQSEELPLMKAEVQGNLLKVEIPLSTFGNSKLIIMSAYTAGSQGKVDSSRWQLFKIK
ncbi:MAG TPA: PIG-L family deacetylase [Methanobacteriaceae archaeon]|nr:PIG-L family deacetylase [Methanobacteriaceae archaeon]